MDAARERVLAGLAEPPGQVRGQVLVGVQALDLDPGVREPPGVVGPDDWGDRAVLVGGGHDREVTL